MPLTIAINLGDKIIAGDKTITLLSIADNSVRVSVNGQADVIQQYHQKEINGISIYVRKIISVTSPNAGKSSAELIIGTDAKTELIYVPYQEPETTPIEKQPQTQIKPQESVKPEAILKEAKPTEQPIQQKQPETESQIQQQTQKQKQEPQIFNLIELLKLIANKLKFY